MSSDAGDRPLKYTYDRAGRQIRVDEQISTGLRPLKEFFYARDNPSGSERPRGQLVMAKRTNWVALPGTLPAIEGGVPLVVTDHFEYFGLGGRVSKKTTSISLASGSQSFSTSFEYGPLGDIAEIDYPRADWPLESAPVRQVAFERDLGFLTTVPGFASSITYQLGGMPSTASDSSTATTGWASSSSSRPPAKPGSTPTTPATKESSPGNAPSTAAGTIPTSSATPSAAWEERC